MKHGIDVLEMTKQDDFLTHTVQMKLMTIDRLQ